MYTLYMILLKIIHNIKIKPTKLKVVHSTLRLDIMSKLYIPRTINTGCKLWHTQLIVYAYKYHMRAIITRGLYIFTHVPKTFFQGSFFLKF